MIAGALVLMFLMSGALHAQAPSYGPCGATFPLGSWTIDANGHQGTLYITGVNSGVVTGTMVLVGESASAIRGFWNAAACRLTFVRIPGTNVVSANPTLIQAYTGYAYPVLHTNPNGAKRMAGNFDTFSNGAGGLPTRSTFGWDANRYY
jgi:hypothetical protein